MLPRKLPGLNVLLISVTVAVILFVHIRPASRLLLKPHPQALGPSSKAAFTFGLITDVQYADWPDGTSYDGVPRHYRASLPALERAVGRWRAAGVDFALSLGDSIDKHKSAVGGSGPGSSPGSGIGPGLGSGSSASEQALQRVLRAFSKLERPVLHVIGNHELYNHPRAELNRRLGIDELKDDPSAPYSYYTYSPRPGWRLIVLDGYHVSVLGWPPGHPLHKEAAALLRGRDPNAQGPERRFVDFGGGLGAEQRGWLQTQLRGARERGERAIVCCHLCIHPRSCSGPWYLYDYQETLQVLAAYSDVVAATLAGHAHTPGEHRDEHGILHRVFRGVIETPLGQDSYAIVSVDAKQIEVQGFGGVESAVWELG